MRTRRPTALLPADRAHDHMNGEWNGRKWPAYLERGHRAENFDGHIAYTRMDGYGVIKDLISWTSDAMDDSL